MEWKIARTLPPAASPIWWHDIINGIKCISHPKGTAENLSKELQYQFNVAYCYFVSSGKTALTLTLKALHELHPDRDEVVIPAFTCYSVPSAIVRAGLRIRLCDINPQTLDFDYAQLQKIITQRQNKDGKSKILTIIPIHMFGIPSDVCKLKTIRNNDKFWIVEDAAQAMGNKLGDRLLGTIGDVGIFSTGRGKSISAVEGGIIVTNNQTIANEIGKQIKKIPKYKFYEIFNLIIYAIALNMLMRPNLFWIPKMIPFLKMGETIYDPNFKMRKMSLFQAGLLEKWIQKLKEMQNTRLSNVGQWLGTIRGNNANIFKIPECINKKQYGKLLDNALIRLPLICNKSEVREKLLKLSEEKGLGIMPTYPESINKIRNIRNRFINEDYPNASKMAKSIVTLPTHLFVSATDRMKISILLEQLSDETKI